MASLKCPKTVRIFGRDFPISFENLVGVFGLCFPSEQHIKIQKGLTQVEEVDTVLHEVIHAIDYQMNLDMTELQVRGLATGLIGVFSDNPKFASYVAMK
jgi:hypothetical protein